MKSVRISYSKFFTTSSLFFLLRWTGLVREENGVGTVDSVLRQHIRSERLVTLLGEIALCEWTCEGKEIMHNYVHEIINVSYTS